MARCDFSKGDLVKLCYNSLLMNWRFKITREIGIVMKVEEPVRQLSLFGQNLTILWSCGVVEHSVYSFYVTALH